MNRPALVSVVIIVWNVVFHWGSLCVIAESYSTAAEQHPKLGKCFNHSGCAFEKNKYCDKFQQCFDCSYCCQIAHDSIDGKCPKLCACRTDARPQHVQQGRIVVRHMRKAGGTSIEQTIQRYGCIAINQEWIPFRPVREFFTITHFRHPIDRILSAFAFEGAAKSCWKGCFRNNATARTTLGARLAAAPRFKEYVTTSIKFSRWAWLMGKPQLNDPTGVFGRIGVVDNYYIRTLLDNFKTECPDKDKKVFAQPISIQNRLVDWEKKENATAGPVSPQLSMCHVDQAMKLLKTEFDKIILFEHHKVHVITPESGRKMPQCLQDFNFSKWSHFTAYDYIHEVGSNPMDNLVGTALHEMVNMIKLQFAHELHILRDLNQFDIELFNRLRAVASE